MADRLKVFILNWKDWLSVAGWLLLVLKGSVFRVDKLLYYRERQKQKEHFFYVQVSVQRNKFLFNKINRRTNFPNLFLSRNSTCFGQFLSSILVVLESSHQTCMIYTSGEYTVENSWWWAEELPETCRFSWQKYVLKISGSVGFIKNKWNIFFRRAPFRTSGPV